MGVTEPAADPPKMVTAYQVHSDRDNALVCGPYAHEYEAKRERDRLNQEARDLAPGQVNHRELEPLPANTYRVEKIQVEEGTV